MSAFTNKLVPPAPILLAYMYLKKTDIIMLFVLQLEHGFDLIVSRMS